jgi:hypothetical protein
MTVRGQTAQVFLPLVKHETDFIRTTEKLTPDLEGKEVVVSFMNGDLNQGIIMGVLEDDDE